MLREELCRSIDSDGLGLRLVKFVVYGHAGFTSLMYQYTLVYFSTCTLSCTSSVPLTGGGIKVLGFGGISSEFWWSPIPFFEGQRGSRVSPRSERAHAVDEPGPAAACRKQQQKLFFSFPYILSKNTHFGDQSIFQLLLLIVLKAS